MHVFGAAHQWCACAPKTNIMPNRHALMHKVELVLRIAYDKCAAAAVRNYALRPCLGARSQQLAAIGHQKGAAALVTALAASGMWPAGVPALKPSGPSGCCHVAANNKLALCGYCSINHCLGNECADNRPLAIPSRKKKPCKTPAALWPSTAAMHWTAV